MYLSLAFVHGGQLHNTPRHSREIDYIELWGKKTFKWTGTSLCHADSILACYATSLIFIENILIFSHPLFFNSLLVCKRFDCVFSKLFFFPDRDPMRQVFGEKNFQWGLRSIMPRGPYFGLSRKSSNFIFILRKIQNPKEESMN